MVMLIILRGNSGSGKSTTAQLVREVALQRGYSGKIALVEQDYLRRIVLKERESQGSDAIELIYQTVAYALKRQYAVILEGILLAERYRPTLKRLIKLAGDHQEYYFDIPLEETFRRHATKSNVSEFGETEMTAWYHPHDVLELPNEHIITADMSQAQIVETIVGRLLKA